MGKERKDRPMLWKTPGFICNDRVPYCETVILLYTNELKKFFTGTPD